ncbi:MAG: hypothetical protein ACOVLE_11190, partial [Pirellula staleyi]
MKFPSSLYTVFRTKHARRAGGHWRIASSMNQMPLGNPGGSSLSRWDYFLADVFDFVAPGLALPSLITLAGTNLAGWRMAA